MMDIRKIIEENFPIIVDGVYFRTREVVLLDYYVYEHIHLEKINIELLNHYFINNGDVIGIKIKEKIIKILKNNENDNYFLGIDSLRNQYNMNKNTTFFEFQEKGNIYFLNKKILTIEGASTKYRKNAREIAFIEYMERLCGIENNDFEYLPIQELSTKRCLLFNKLKKINSKVKVIRKTSLLRNLEYFIPFNYVYYISKSFDAAILGGSSNGVAVGTNYYDAVVRGALEVIERSDFMQVWFDNKEILELTFDESCLEILNFINIMKLEGYKVRFFYLNIRENSRIKTIWCLAESISTDNSVYSMTGVATDFQFLNALKKSFFEMKKTLDIWNEKNFFTRISKKKDHDELTKILLYFSSYERKANFNNMLRNIRKKTLNYTDVIQNIDPDERKNVLLSEITEYYDDIIGIDISNEGIKDLNLNCVKVIIVGSKDVVFTKKINQYGFEYQPLA